MDQYLHKDDDDEEEDCGGYSQYYISVTFPPEACSRQQAVNDMYTYIISIPSQKCFWIFPRISMKCFHLSQYFT